ncbi:MAG TPA: polyprenyl synthetase family protein [Candidatus Parabacteroides intestinipullorum]|uniref:Polyprenyl synthetase family protein n=1 Tax=Candidatus Parabacteroides intestinipullorum TaxID=2838723 RepID=A0A9D1XA88_9BACT|nr:polyprenyl synthetase family protein [Candidatus Parabacteroides intestinipullorum]
MRTFEEICRTIEEALARLTFDQPPRSLFDPITYTLSLGGKRIRPALALMACDLFGGKNEDVLQPALGLEVFHNFTLLHDDLMDEADRRRDKPTVHKLWNPNVAILSGDAMLICAYQLVAKANDKAILELFSRTALEICAGQQYDMEFESRSDVTEEEYLEMIRLKTAVLLACALKVGAMIGGASTADADALYDYGIHIGLAFQLQDDLLDVYGDPKTFGKNIGGDILCNKKTFLLINALSVASEEQRQVMEDWMARKTYDAQEKIAAFTNLYNELSIRDLTERRIEDYYRMANEDLARLSIAPETLSVLKGTCDRLMKRKS